jgi:hypothetical protein
MQKKYFLAMLFLCFITATQSAFAVPIIDNGSLTGPIDNNGVPTGWTIYAGTPDTMDENNNVGGSYGYFGATPSPSPDGGTWVGIADAPSISIFETFGQTVDGFDIGTTYSVSWYQANFGYTFAGYINPDSIGLLIDGILVGNSSISPLATGWTLETVEFTATDTSHLLSFAIGSEPGQSYLSIDGISIQSAPVPEPATLLLLSLGLAGLAGSSRKKFKK